MDDWVASFTAVPFTVDGKRTELWAMVRSPHEHFDESEEFNLELSDGQSVWKTTVGSDRKPSSLEEDPSVYIQNVVAALQMEVDNVFTFSLLKGEGDDESTWTMTIKKRLGTLGWLEYCCVPVQLVDDCGAAMRQIFDQLLSQVTKLGEKRSKLREEIERLLTLSSEQQSSLVEAQQAKEDNERLLVANFVDVLNTKKAKIAELSGECNRKDEEIQRLKQALASQPSAGAAEYKGSDGEATDAEDEAGLNKSMRHHEQAPDSEDEEPEPQGAPSFASPDRRTVKSGTTASSYSPSEPSLRYSSLDRDETLVGRARHKPVASQSVAESQVSEAPSLRFQDSRRSLLPTQNTTPVMSLRSSDIPSMGSVSLERIDSLDEAQEREAATAQQRVETKSVRSLNRSARSTRSARTAKTAASSPSTGTAYKGRRRAGKRTRPEPADARSVSTRSSKRARTSVSKTERSTRSSLSRTSTRGSTQSSGSSGHSKRSVEGASVDLFDSMT